MFLKLQGPVGANNPKDFVESCISLPCGDDVQIFKMTSTSRSMKAGAKRRAHTLFGLVLQLLSGPPL